MILEEPLSIPAALQRIGWPWHGRLERSVGATPVQRLVMPGRTITSGDPVSDNPAAGTWTILCDSSDNYLWAPPGLEPEPDEGVEGQGGAWLAQAILRGPGMLAYGGLSVASFAGGPRATWPVWFDGVKGQAALFGFVGAWELRICENDTLGAEEPVAYRVPVADVDWDQATPPVYINGALATQHALPDLLDISRDGRSALFAVRTFGNTGVQFGSMLTGLLRLDISGPPGARTAAWVLERGRAACVGTLSNDDDGGLTSAPITFAPMALVQQGGVPPSCSSTVFQAPGEFVTATGAPGEGDIIQANLGTTARTVRRLGALFAAWFDDNAEVVEVRFDLRVIETVSNSRQTESSGLREQIDTFTFDGTSCASTGTTTTDTRHFSATGQIDYSLKRELTLHGPGGVIDVLTAEYIERVEVAWDISDYNTLIGTREIDIEINGVNVLHYADTTIPPQAAGLAPGSLSVFGRALTISPLTHDSATERRAISAPLLGFVGQIGVLPGSNKTVTLASLWRVGGSGPWTVGSGMYATPSGAAGAPATGSLSLGVGGNLSDALQFVRASHNPITGELARAWPANIHVNWV